MPKKQKYYRRPDGLYETSRNVNGKRIRFRGRTVAEVDRKILEFNAEAKKGRLLSVIADEWFEMHRRGVSEGTAGVYRPYVCRFKETFGRLRASELKPLDIKRHISSRESLGYARQTVATELGIVKQIMAHAVLAGDIDSNPATEVRHSRGLPQTKRSALTEEQERKVECCRTGRWWLLGIMFLYTGCRKGELLALSWQDIDWQQGVIHVTKKINHAAGKCQLEHHLKSENGRRDIPIFAPLAAVLPRNCIGTIFTDDAGKYLGERQFYRVWREYCQDAGLMERVVRSDGSVEERPAFTPHAMRHSFATMCYEAGLDPKATAAIVGDTEKIVRDIYTDLRDRHKATSVDKINAFLEMRAAERAAAHA